MAQLVRPNLQFSSPQVQNINVRPQFTVQSPQAINRQPQFLVPQTMVGSQEMRFNNQVSSPIGFVSNARATAVPVSRPSVYPPQRGSYRDHHFDPHIDKLYDPLRYVVTPPELREIDASRKQVRIITELERSRMESEMMIPVDTNLVPTINFHKIEGKQFVTVNEQQRVIGNPISQIQLRKVLEDARHSEVVYDEGPNDKLSSAPPIQRATGKLHSAPPPQEQTYEPNLTETTYTKENYKYNLFSAVDEPVNKCGQQGCGFFGCPSNQIIASRALPESIAKK